MAVPSISTSFIEEFESGVHMAYQRMGSKLRNTVRNRAGMKNKTTFQKIGKGFATTKARHGAVAPMNLEHTNVNVTLEDYFAGEWIDDLDQLRINHDEMLVAQQSGAYALGRKTDDLILAAMTTTTSSHDETTNGITLAWSLELMEKFGAKEGSAMKMRRALDDPASLPAAKTPTPASSQVAAPNATGNKRQDSTSLMSIRWDWRAADGSHNSLCGSWRLDCASSSRGCCRERGKRAL